MPWAHLLARKRDMETTVQAWGPGVSARFVAYLENSSWTSKWELSQSKNDPRPCPTPPWLLQTYKSKNGEEIVENNLAPEVAAASEPSSFTSMKALWIALERKISLLSVKKRGQKHFFSIRGRKAFNCLVKKIWKVWETYYTDIVYKHN